MTIRGWGEPALDMDDDTDERDTARQCSKGWGDRCARARSPRCRCQCGGHNHGNPKADRRGREGRTLADHLGPGASQSPLFIPYGAKAMRQTPKCRWCGKELCGPVIGYPHDGGWLVPGLASREANGRWWLFLVCAGCNYEWALWKLGVARDWTPEKAAE